MFFFPPQTLGYDLDQEKFSSINMMDFFNFIYF